MKGRPLTYDETKAAEAAFAGLPFNPNWSMAAYAVYEGIRQAMGKRSLVPELSVEESELAVVFSSLL